MRQSTLMAGDRTGPGRPATRLGRAAVELDHSNAAFAVEEQLFARSTGSSARVAPSSAGESGQSTVPDGTIHSVGCPVTRAMRSKSRS